MVLYVALTVDDQVIHSYHPTINEALDAAAEDIEHGLVPAFITDEAHGIALDIDGILAALIARARQRHCGE